MTMKASLIVCLIVGSLVVVSLEASPVTEGPSELGHNVTSRQVSGCSDRWGCYRGKCWAGCGFFPGHWCYVTDSHASDYSYCIGDEQEACAKETRCYSCKSSCSW